MLTSLYSLITFIILLYFTIKSVKRMSIGSTNVINFVIIILFVFNAFPIILDLVIGKPEFLYFYKGFIAAFENASVTYYYNTLMIYVFSVLHFYGTKNIGMTSRKINNSETLSRKNSKYSNFLISVFIIIIIFIPVFHVLLSPYISNFSVYGSPGFRGINDYEFLTTNNYLRMLSMIAIAFWLNSKLKTNTAIEILVLINAIPMLVWIDGKRNIIPLLAMILFYTIWARGMLRGRKIKYLLVLGMISVIIFSVNYQKESRTVTISDEQMYTSYRIDFGRDTVTKFAIMKEIDQVNPILEYRGQSFLSTIFAFVPRNLWIDKPLQHHSYLTSSILGLPPQQLSWGITTTIFDQLIANFGILGSIISPFIFVYLSKIGEKYNNNNLRILIIIICAGLLTMNIDYILPVIAFFVLTLLIIKTNKLFKRVNKSGKNTYYYK